LLFVPAVFAVMDDVGSAIWRLFSRHVGAVDEPAEPKPPLLAPPSQHPAEKASPSVLESKEAKSSMEGLASSCFP
jgi:hypothetical protein